MANQFLKKHSEKEEISAQNMIIKPVKRKVKRDALPHSIMVVPIIAYGFSLKTLHI